MRTRTHTFGKGIGAMNLIIVWLLMPLLLCDSAKGANKRDWSHVESKHELFLEGRVLEEVIVEQILKEHPSSRYNSSFSTIVNTYLDGLMVKFRSRVFNLYRKLTCGDGFCDPWNAELDLTRSDILNRPSSLKLKINEIGLWHKCSLPSSTSSYVIFKKSLKTFLVTGSLAHPTVSLYEFGGDGQCRVIGSFNAAPNPCFATFGSEEYPFLFVGHCQNWTKTGQHVNVLLVTEGLERLQLIDVKNLQQMFTLEHLKSAYAFIISTDDKVAQNCNLYQWIDMFFEKVATFPTNLGLLVKSFSYGKESYLVSTNYANLDHSPVTIWQFIPYRNSSWLKMYQVLNDCETSDAEPFTVGGLQFLAVACSEKSNKTESYLYWWTGSQFLLWQSIPSKAIVAWIAVKLTNDDTALIMHLYENDGHTLQVLQLDDGYYWPNNAKLKGLFPHRKMSDIKIGNIQHMGMQLLTATENSETGSLFISFRLQFEMDHPEKSIVGNYDEELACISMVNAEIFEEEKRIQTIEKALLELQKLKSKKVAASQVRTLKESNRNAKCNNLAAQLTKAESKIKAAESQLTQYAAPKLSNYDSLTVNRLTVRGSVEAPNAFVRSGMISGVDISDLQRTVVSKTKDQIFNASVTFHGGLNTLFLEVGSTLNGERIAGNLAMNGKENVFTKPQHFHSMNVDHLALLNMVNHIKFDNIVLESRRQTIHGKKTIKKLIAQQNVLLHGGEINGVNIEAFFNRTLTVSGDQFISGPITFEGDVTIDGDVVCATINDINLNNLAKKVVTTNTPQKINGKKKFMATMTVGNAKLSGKLNKVAIPNDILTRYTSQTIHHDVKIYGDVMVKKNLTVERTVNDVILLKSLVTRCGNHTITGHKEFRNTVIADDFRDEKPGSVWQYFGDLTVDNLKAYEVNGINLQRLKHLMRKSKPQTFTGSLKCSSTIFKDVIVESLNGGNLDEMFITKKTNQTIFTPLVIKTNVVFNGAVEMKNVAAVNGLDISSLPKLCVMKKGDQIVKGHNLFKKIKTLSGIIVEHNDGTSIEVIPHLLKDKKIDIVTVNGNVKVKDLKIGLLNGHHLNGFIAELFKTNGSISLSNGKLFENLIIKGNLYLNTHLNGVNVTELLSKIVRLSTNQVITGDVKFVKSLESYGPLHIKTVNGKILEERINKLVMVDNHNRITVPVTFQNGLKVDGNVNVALLNGRDITNFMRNVLLNTAYQRFDFASIIGNTFIGDIKIATDMNGLKPSDLILINKDINLNSDVSFKAPVTFSSLRVNGTVHLSNTSKVIPKFKVLKAKSILLQGNINGFSSSELSKMVLSRTGLQNFSTGELILKDVSVDHLTLKRPVINGIDLDDFRSRAVTTNKKQVITGKKIWEAGNLTMTEDVVIDGNITTSTFTGVDMNITKMSVINEQINVALSGGTYYGDVFFEDKVYVKGHVNGLHLPNDIILKSNHQTLEKLESGNDVEIRNLTVTGLVNGVDLDALVKNRITLKTNQTIYGNMTFYKVHMNGSIPCKDEHSILEYRELTRPKHIWENVSFTCPVVIDGHIRSRHPLNVELKHWPPLHSLTKSLSARNSTACFRTLSKVVEGLSEIINFLEIANYLLESHSIIHVNYKDNVYFLLATRSISHNTCNNIKTFRCDKGIANCHQTKGVFKVPKGFVKEMYASEENGITNLAYVMEEKGFEGFNPSNCPGLYDGVFIFKDILEKTRAYFLIPASKVTSILLLRRQVTQLIVLLSSSEFGTRIYSLKKNSQPKILDNKEGMVMGSTILQLSRNLLVLQIIRQDSRVKLVAHKYNGNDSTIVPNFEASLPKTASKIVAFRILNEKYIVISSDTVRVYNMRDSSINEVQKLPHVAKDLKKFEYFGRLYLLVLDKSNEMTVYRWTDLLNFILVTRIQFQHPVDVVYPIIMEKPFIVASSSTNTDIKSWSTIIYRGVTSGHGLKHYC